MADLKLDYAAADLYVKANFSPVDYITTCDCGNLDLERDDILNLARAYRKTREREERLIGVLFNFLENPLFTVSVGGNPIVVEAMLNRARAALKEAQS